jgi:uncharacterized protein
MRLGAFLFAMSIIALSGALRNFRSKVHTQTKTALNMSTSAKPTKRNFILEYVYVADILEKRTPYRPDHIKLAEDYNKEKLIISGGPFSPPTGAVFVFSAEGKETVEEFVAKDPYVAAGLVSSFSIREWNVVIGAI